MPVKAETPVDYKVRCDIQVRFRDTDGLAHVNNAVYLSYLELARMHYWKALTGSDDFTKVGFIVARVEIDYRSPVLAHEAVEVLTRVSELRRSSFVMEYRLIEKASGRLVAEAKTVQVCYDYAAKKVKRADPAMRERILAFEAPNPVAVP